MTLRASIALVLAALLAGCGASFPRPLPGDTLAAYLREGGVAGFDDLLVVHRDGTVTLTAARRPAVRLRLGARALERLRRDVASADLSSEGVHRDCCDMLNSWVFAGGRTFANPVASGRADGRDRGLEDLRQILDRAERRR